MIIYQTLGIILNYDNVLYFHLWNSKSRKFLANNS